MDVAKEQAEKFAVERLGAPLAELFKKIGDLENEVKKIPGLEDEVKKMGKQIADLQKQANRTCAKQRCHNPVDTNLMYCKTCVEERVNDALQSGLSSTLDKSIGEQFGAPTTATP